MGHLQLGQRFQVPVMRIVRVDANTYLMSHLHVCNVRRYIYHIFTIHIPIGRFVKAKPPEPEMRFASTLAGKRPPGGGLRADVSQATAMASCHDMPRRNGRAMPHT